MLNASQLGELSQILKYKWGKRLFEKCGYLWFSSTQLHLGV
jgi:hypothetical protein